MYLAFACGVASLSSCVTHSHGAKSKGLPPGKAKKIFGTKSAKPFAPGQQKKHGKRGAKHQYDMLYEGTHQDSRLFYQHRIRLEK